MEKEYIYDGANVDEAIKKGLDELNLTEEHVKIEVIDGGKSGIFGLFKKPAKVRLIPLLSEEEFEKLTKKPKIKEQKSKSEEKIVKKEIKKEVKQEKPVQPKKKEEVVAINNQKESEEKVSRETKQQETKNEVKKEKREDYIVKNKEKLVNYLTNIVRSMGYKDATVDFIEHGGRHFTLDIKSEENTCLIIGKRGVTLNSLQFLVNNYAKKFSSHYFRIEVDCDNYRETRKKTLEDLAINLAKKSKKTGRPVELEPMTSVERKIIHNALTGIKNVETESRGEEPFRYLVITAK